MKNHSFLLPAVVMLGLAAAATAAPPAIYDFSFTNGFANAGFVPDGNATGWSDARTLSGFTESSIADVNVSLRITGGYNGDLFAYLAHDGAISILLNRVGTTGANPFGYGDAGLSVVLDDTAFNGDIHLYQTVTGFSTRIGNGSAWAPDGRTTSPLSVLDSDSRSRLLNQFNGLNPAGEWTLLVADLSGGSQGKVEGWGLSIATIPEPSVLGLILMGAGLLGTLKRRQ